MGRVFTITQGLENLGAIKTGGQGSVYKARRADGSISAVKIIPTPIHSETRDDKHFSDFQNEVNKLKKVNQEPNPHVVPIRSWGLTESGSFPFIEMEFVEGPDLEELLHPPLDTVFAIKRAIHVAEQLSDALAHCHRLGVKHGDVKSNNIKYNLNTGNYVLLDFGMAIMTDEQRRTSLRRAGAVEFMAPEQNEGQIFFETDVYSYGVILFEILAGTVPFPLKEKGETARNNIIIAHMERPVPDLLELRRKNLPVHWEGDKREEEMLVPEWLISIVYKCLEKRKEDRFSDATVLNASVVNRTVQQINRTPVFRDDDIATKAALLARENEELRRQLERAQLQREPVYTQHTQVQKRSSGVRNFFLVLLLLAALGSAAYFVYQSQADDQTTAMEPGPVIPQEEEKKVEEEPTPKEEEKPAELTEAQITEQLAEAKRLIDEGQTADGLYIYRFLAEKEIPEAMYMYGDLGLRKVNTEIDCGRSWEMVEKASDKGYAPAMRTLGFLYVFADSDEVLRINNYHECSYDRDIYKGSKLLMEAVISGDSVAKRLLDELNFNRQDTTTQGGDEQ